MTMAEMERKMASLEKRVVELEKQVEALQLRPPVLHFHYPAPLPEPTKFPDYQPWWTNPVIC